MIGYVMLVSVAIIMSVIVYNWLKTYTPTEGTECPDVSIALGDVVCEDGSIKLSVKNTGKFNIEGYFIKGVLSPTEDIATWVLSDGDLQGFVSFSGNQPLTPGENRIKAVNFSQALCNKIESLCSWTCANKPEYSRENILGAGCEVLSSNTACETTNIPGGGLSGSYCYWTTNYLINSLEIIPVKKIITESGKKVLPTCQNARIKETVNCKVYK